MVEPVVLKMIEDDKKERLLHRNESAHFRKGFEGTPLMGNFTVRFLGFVAATAAFTVSIFSALKSVAKPWDLLDKVIQGFVFVLKATNGCKPSKKLFCFFPFFFLIK